VEESMGKRRTDAAEILAFKKSTDFLALVPPHLRGIQLRMIVVGRIVTHDGPAIVVLGSDNDGKKQLLDVLSHDDGVGELTGAALVTRLRARGLYVDPEQTVPVFFDRNAAIVPREVVVLLSRSRRMLLS
jgi:hypothetical protein